MSPTIEPTAVVFGDAEVSGYARVFGNARVFGSAQVSGEAWVGGNARVHAPHHVQTYVAPDGHVWTVCRSDAGPLYFRWGEQVADVADPVLIALGEAVMA